MKIQVRVESPRWMSDDYEYFEMEVPDDSSDEQIQELAEQEAERQATKPNVYWQTLPLKPPHSCKPAIFERLLDAAATPAEFCECGRWRIRGTKFWNMVNCLPRAVQ